MSDIVHTLADKILAAIISRLDLPTEAMDRLDGILPKIEDEVRREYGGDRAYIKKPGCADEARRQTVVRDYLQSDEPAENVARRHGISRATLYNYIKR